MHCNCQGAAIMAKAVRSCTETSAVGSTHQTTTGQPHLTCRNECQKAVLTKQMPAWAALISHKTHTRCVMIRQSIKKGNHTAAKGRTPQHLNPKPQD